MDNSDEIPNDLKIDILGSRKRILFTEGNEVSSIDSPLYSAIFPAITIKPKGSCKKVFESVLGIKENEILSWVEPFGLVDRDGRSDEEIAKIETGNVYCLSVYYAESIYYDEYFQTEVAKKNHENWKEMTESAKAIALIEIKNASTEIAKYLVEKKMRLHIENSLPMRKHIGETALEIIFDTVGELQSEIKQLNTLCDKGDLQTILKYYPIRGSAALSRICKELGFANRQAYESAVIKLIKENDEARGRAKDLVGNLSNHL